MGIQALWSTARSGYPRGGEAMRKLHHITRLDYVYGTKRTHGWWVRFQRKDQETGRRKAIGKTFTDAKYGGKAKALAAAIKWRDENMAKYPSLRNGAAPGRRQAPIGHSIFWEYDDGLRRTLNGNIKVEDGQRSAQVRYSIREYGRKGALAMIRRWYLAQRRMLRKKGTLASDATLKEYWSRLEGVRPKARRLPWTA